MPCWDTSSDLETQTQPAAVLSCWRQRRFKALFTYVLEALLFVIVSANKRVVLT